ncbi:MAG: PKD domain-containing protein, partial [Roseovarius sp.]|nr:PKD domain-containing protein [Roseovarius sp.]
FIMAGGTDLVVRGNDVHSVRIDAMNFIRVENILIEENYLHDFIRAPGAGDHADMIQFWTNGTTAPSTNVTIRSNVLDIGEGDATQSIFMRNEEVDRGRAGEEMFYRNILIEDNVIINGHAHGITVGETNGLVIRNNTVLHADGGNVDGVDASVEIPKINVSSTSINVTIANNITAGISGGGSGQTDWTINNNILAQDQDPNAPNFYGDLFIASTLTPKDGQHNFLTLPGGPIDTLGAGASATRDTGADAPLDARFHITDHPESGAARIFDARLTAGDFEALPADAKFFWDFGDGGAATGAVVDHAFAQGGWYDVKLTVTANGASATETARIGVKGPEVVALGANGGFVASSYGVDTLLDPSAMASSEGIQLGTAGAAGVAREHLAGLFQADNFAISMTLKADAAGTSGELFRIHQSFLASV